MNNKVGNSEDFFLDFVQDFSLGIRFLNLASKMPQKTTSRTVGFETNTLLINYAVLQ